MPKPSKFEQVKAIVQEETAWSGGTLYPWEGGALNSPWFLEKLCLLASYAPQIEIDRFKRELKES